MKWNFALYNRMYAKKWKMKKSLKNGFKKLFSGQILSMYLPKNSILSCLRCIPIKNFFIIVIPQIFIKCRGGTNLVLVMAGTVIPWLTWFSITWFPTTWKYFQSQRDFIVWIESRYANFCDKKNCISSVFYNVSFD